MLAVEILLLSVMLNAVAAASVLEPEGKIVGGKDADIKDFPYLVEYLALNRVIGAASVLSEYWALTGATVVTLSTIRDITKYFMELETVMDKRDTESDYIHLIIRSGSTSALNGGQIHNLAEVHVFDTYDNTYYTDDIALVKVKEMFVYSASVQPINLPAKDLEVDNGTMVQLAGWGDLKERGLVGSKTLQQAELPLLDFATCVILNKNHPIEISHAMPDSTKQICTLNPGGGKDACIYDDGTPLVYNNSVIGLYSYGWGCAYRKHPSVYTKVTGYLDWIKETSGV